MRKSYEYDGPQQYYPLSPWAYFWYSVLFLIPVVGFLFLLVFTFSRKNINRRNFARSYWCGLILCITITFMLVVLSAAGILPHIRDWHEGLSKIPTMSTVLSTTSPTGTSNGPTTIAYSNSQNIPDGVSRELYDAMASYEAFFDKYVEFMDRYESSNNTADMAIDYMNYMVQYGNTMQKIEEIDESKLTNQEEIYFAEVMIRINRKLAGSL